MQSTTPPSATKPAAPPSLAAVTGSSATAIIQDARRTTYAQITRASEAFQQAAPGSQAEIEARGWHQRLMEEDARLEALGGVLRELIEADRESAGAYARCNELNGQGASDEARGEAVAAWQAAVVTREIAVQRLTMSPPTD